MVLLYSGAGVLRAGALGQNNGLHFAGSVALDLVAGKSIDRRRLSQIVPFLILGLSMGLLAVWWERYHQGTHGALFALTLPERILVASRAVCFYLSKLFWPSNLIFIYPKWTISAAHVLDYAWLVVGIAACVLISFTRRFFGRAVEVAAVFVATLSPVLGFIMLYTFATRLSRTTTNTRLHRTHRARLGGYRDSRRQMEENPAIDPGSCSMCPCSPMVSEFATKRDVWRY